MIGPSGRRGWMTLALLAALVALVLYAILRGPLIDKALNVGFRAVTGEQGGTIALSEARLRPGAEHWILDARADIELPVAVQAGLDSGLPLHFILDLDVLPRPADVGWLEEDGLDRRYSLAYYELTRHYRVHDESNGEYRNFRSLRSALNGLGNFDALDIAALDVQQSVRTASLSMRLDTRQLPLPLQPLLRSPWRLNSKRLTWQID